LVLVLLVLIFSAWAVAFRQTAALLRIETVQAGRVDLSQTNVLALSQALVLLQTGTPETQPTWDAVRSQYACTTTIDEQSFVLTYKKLAPGSWSVLCTPGSQGPAMPATFGE
jgi:hypothetical protein